MPCASGSKLTPGRAVVSRWYERTGAIRCTADAPAAKSRACGLPARVMTCRSCGGAARPGPPPAISGPSSCRSTKPSTSSLPKASSGSVLDAYTRYKTCKAKLSAVAQRVPERDRCTVGSPLATLEGETVERVVAAIRDVECRPIGRESDAGEGVGDK